MFYYFWAQTNHKHNIDLLIAIITKFFTHILQKKKRSQLYKLTREYDEFFLRFYKPAIKALRHYYVDNILYYVGLLSLRCSTAGPTVCLMEVYIR